MSLAVQLACNGSVSFARAVEVPKSQRLRAACVRTVYMVPLVGLDSCSSVFHSIVGRTLIMTTAVLRISLALYISDFSL